MYIKSVSVNDNRVQLDLPFYGTIDKRITQASTCFETSFDVINECDGPGVQCGESASGIAAEVLVGTTQHRTAIKDRHFLRCGKGRIKVYLSIETSAAELTAVAIAPNIAKRVIWIRDSSIWELQTTGASIVPHGRILVPKTSTGAGTVKRSDGGVPSRARIPSGETLRGVIGVVAHRPEGEELVAGSVEKVAVTA